MRTIGLFFTAALALAACRDRDRSPTTSETRTTSAPTHDEDVDRAMAASLTAQLHAAGYTGLTAGVADGVVHVAGVVPHDKREKALDLVRAGSSPYKVEDDTVSP